MDFIGYGKQWLDEDDISAVAEVLRSDFLTQGPKVREFEEALARYTGARFAVAVANGTAALQLAVQALELEEGTVGVTSPNTFAASSNCFLYNRLTPGFADIDERTYCMEPGELEQVMTPGTGVVIPVHFAGQPCDMEGLAEVVNRQAQRVYIIEDAPHAIGSRYANGQRVGSCCYSDMATFSFHPVKTIATGEGGAVTTNAPELYRKLQLLRTHGITKDPGSLQALDMAPELRGTDWNGPWYYEMQELGYNYRMTEMQAALGITQLKKIDSFIQRRREIVDRYNKVFDDVPWLTAPFERERVSSAFHLYVLKIDFQAIKKTRTQVMEELRGKGIGTQVHYIPVHLQPYYRRHFGFGEGNFPRAEAYYSQCLSIPLFPRMTDDDVRRVIQAVKDLALDN